MKKFKTHRYIRKKAVIMGLPISLFALMMTSVIISMILIIFSFSLLFIITTFVFNGLLFLGLSIYHNNPTNLSMKNIFPDTISNKRKSVLIYEDN